jgi:hypothetical protein
MERGVQVPRRQGLPVLTMGKTLKFSATSATTLPGTKKVKWPGMFSKNQKKLIFLIFFKGINSWVGPLSISILEKCKIFMFSFS